MTPKRPENKNNLDVEMRDDGLKVIVMGSIGIKLGINLIFSLPKKYSLMISNDYTTRRVQLAMRRWSNKEERLLYVDNVVFAPRKGVLETAFGVVHKTPTRFIINKMYGP